MGSSPPRQLTDGSIHDRAAVSPAVARLLLSDKGSHARAVSGEYLREHEGGCRLGHQQLRALRQHQGRGAPCRGPGIRSSGGILDGMARRADHPLPTYSAQLRQLAAVRGVKLPSQCLVDVLAERGPLRGPVSDAGSRAVQEQRGERD